MLSGGSEPAAPPTPLGWLRAPSPRTGIRFRVGRGWQPATYEELAGRAGAAATVLADARIGAGDAVAIVMPSGPDFVAWFVGAMAIGAVPIPFAPPAPLARRPEDYERFVGERLRAAGAGAVVTTAGMGETLAGIAARWDVEAAVLDGDLEGRPAASLRSAPGGGAFLQFTSGSSGRVRGVVVDDLALAANLHAITDWIGWRPDDAAVSWLPVHHDMGLVGCLLGSLAHQTDLWLLRPEQFVRRPALWFECLGRHGCTLSSAPTFGYRLALDRLDDADLDGLDLSGWRAALVGAERLDAPMLGAFAARTARHGFTAARFRPGYGLAESTLLVSGHGGAEAAPVAAVRRTVGLGRPLEVVAWGRLGALDGLDERDDVDLLVSSGEARAGLEVRVVDGGGPVEDGCLGEVAVRGRSVARRFVVGSPDDQPAIDGDGWLLTGDAGAIVDGALYVVGRLGDSTKRRGQAVFAEPIEAGLAACASLASSRPTVVFLPSTHGDRVVVVAEHPGAGAEADAVAVVRRFVPDAEVAVVATASGGIPVTSSGKPRRAALCQELLGSGALA